MDPRFFREVAMEWLLTIQSAALSAQAEDCNEIETRHLLLALLARVSWPGDNGELIRELAPSLPTCIHGPSTIPEESREVEEAVAYGVSLGRGTVSPLGVLIAILEISALPAPAMKILSKHGLTPEAARAAYRRRYGM